MNLKVKFTTSTTGDQYHAYSIKAEVLEADGITPYIFMYQAGVPELPGKNVVDTFTGVASPVDIEETPENEPDMSKRVPYYRRNSVVLWARSADWLEEIRNRLDSDIAGLVRDYRFLNDENEYRNTETREYG